MNDSSSNPYRSPQAKVEPRRKRRDRTHENRKYASFWMRLLAMLIDSIITMAITIPIGFLLIDAYSPFSVFTDGAGYLETNQDEGTLFTFLGYFIPFAYHVLFWTYMGATPGKLALGIKVVTRDGENLSLGKSALRYLGYIISSLLLLFGYLMMLWDRQSQALHDKIADSYVVRAR